MIAKRSAKFLEDSWSHLLVNDMLMRELDPTSTIINLYPDCKNVLSSRVKAQSSTRSAVRKYWTLAGSFYAFYWMLVVLIQVFGNGVSAVFKNLAFSSCWQTTFGVITQLELYYLFILIAETVCMFVCHRQLIHNFTKRTRLALVRRVPDSSSSYFSCQSRSKLATWLTLRSALVRWNYVGMVAHGWLSACVIASVWVLLYIPTAEDHSTSKLMAGATCGLLFMFLMIFLCISMNGSLRSHHKMLLPSLFPSKAMDDEWNNPHSDAHHYHLALKATLMALKTSPQIRLGFIPVSQWSALLGLLFMVQRLQSMILHSLPAALLT